MSDDMRSKLVRCEASARSPREERIPRRGKSLIIIMLFAAAAAHAGPRETAEALRRVEQGNKLYESGRYEDALRSYLAAYELSPSADTLFNVGLAQEKLLAFEQCVIAFRKYIAQSSDAATKERATERSARCLEKTRVPVKVSSSPPGAAVSLATGSDAATFRGRTPTQLDLAPASYRIKVEMPGYVPLEQTVVVDVGVRPEIDFPLEKLSSLAIESDPSGATVEVDNDPPSATPFRRELRAGTYKIRLHKDAYRDVDREVTIGAGEQQTLVITLPPAPAVRELAIHLPPDGKLEIDGRAAAGQVHLTSGDVRVEARAPGYLPFSGDVAIPRDRGTILDVALTPKRSLVQTSAMWTLAGVATAALVAGAIYGDMAISTRNEFDRMPSVALADRGEMYAHRSDLFMGLAVASALAGGVTWWLTRPRASHVEVR